MKDNAEIAIGALFGATGAAFRTWLELKTGKTVNLWLVIADIILSASLGVVAFGVAREFAYLWFGHGREEVWWTCAAASGMAGSIGPYIVRYLRVLLLHKLNIKPEEINKVDDK